MPYPAWTPPFFIAASYITRAGRRQFGDEAVTLELGDFGSCVDNCAFSIRSNQDALQAVHSQPSQQSSSIAFDPAFTQLPLIGSNDAAREDDVDLYQTIKTFVRSSAIPSMQKAHEVHGYIHRPIIRAFFDRMCDEGLLVRRGRRFYKTKVSKPNSLHRMRQSNEHDRSVPNDGKALAPSLHKHLSRTGIAQLYQNNTKKGWVIKAPIISVPPQRRDRAKSSTVRPINESSATKTRVVRCQFVQPGLSPITHAKLASSPTHLLKFGKPVIVPCTPILQNNQPRRQPAQQRQASFHTMCRCANDFPRKRDNCLGFDNVGVGSKASGDMADVETTSVSAQQRDSLPASPYKSISEQAARQPVVGPLEDDLFGKRIRKSFGSSAFWGTVVDSYVVGCGLFYKVSFDDGDVDILAAHEVLLDVKEAAQYQSDDPCEPEAEVESDPLTESPKSPSYSDLLRTKRGSLKRPRDSSPSDQDERLSASLETQGLGPWQVKLWSTRLFATIMEEDGFIRVQNFVRMTNGDMGEMESTGKVQPGDALVAVQGHVVHGTMDHLQACDLIRSLPRPLSLTFMRVPRNANDTNLAATTAAVAAALTAAKAHTVGESAEEESRQKRMKVATRENQGGHREPAATNSSVPPPAQSIPSLPKPGPANGSRPPSPTVEVIEHARVMTLRDGQHLPASQSSTAHASKPPAPPASSATLYSSDGPILPPTNPNVGQPRNDRVPSRTSSPAPRLPSPSPPATLSGYPGSAAGFSQSPSSGQGSHLNGTMPFQIPRQDTLRHHPQAVFVPAHLVPMGPSQTSFLATQHGRPTSQHAHSSGMHSSSLRVSVQSHPHGLPVRPESLRRYEHAVTTTTASRNSPAVNYRNYPSPMQPHYNPVNQANPGTTTRFSYVPESSYRGQAEEQSGPPAGHHDTQTEFETRQYGVRSRAFETPQALAQNATLGDYMTLAAQQERQSLRAAYQHHPMNRQPPRASTNLSQARYSGSNEASSNHVVGPRRQPSPPPAASSHAQGGRNTINLDRSTPNGINETAWSTGTSFLSLNAPSFLVTMPVVSKPVALVVANSRRSLGPVASQPRASFTQRPMYLKQFESNGVVEISINQPRLFLSLAPMGQYVSVSSFVRGESGTVGEIEASGKVVAGDILVGVGTVPIPPFMSPGDVARIVSSRPRPYTAYFSRASWDVLH